MAAGAVSNQPDVYQIANGDNLCVTVNGNIGQGTPLSLTACQETQPQGWVLYTRPNGATPPVYGGNREPVYYWHGRQRYCWYEDGWNGGGWYVCGRNETNGQGWGGDGWWPGIPGGGFRPSIRPNFRPITRPTRRPSYPSNNEANQ